MLPVRVRRYVRRRAVVQISHPRLPGAGPFEEKSGVITISGQRIGHYTLNRGDNPNITVIAFFDIDEPFRGKGHGLRAAQKLISNLRRRGKMVYADAEDDSIGFWEKVGLHPCGDSPGGQWMC